MFKGPNIYFAKMFRFMRPFAVPFAISQVIYSGQTFMWPFLVTLFASSVLNAVLAADINAIYSAGLQLVSMTAVFVVVLFAATYTNVIIVEKVMLDIKQKLFAKFIGVGPEHSAHSGKGIAAINADADAASDVFRQPLMNFISKIITIIGSVTVILVVDWRIGLFTLAIGALSFYMQMRFSKPLAAIGKKQLEANADAVTVVGDAYAGRMAIRAYNIQPQVQATFNKHNELLKMLDIKRGFIQMWQGTFKTVESWLILLLVFGLGGWMAANELLDFGQLAIIFGMSSILAAAIGGLGATYADLQPPIAGAKRIFEIFETDAAEYSQTVESIARPPISTELAISNLNFAYLGAKDNTLSDINLKIGKNKIVAVVGKSGSGKSTFLRVLCGIYVRSGLNMKIGGISFCDTNIIEWRKRFAYVDQACTLFNISIKENIALGSAGAVSDEDIINAAKQASAHDFIIQLANGYDTICSEKGESLSGGQKQRIAIARALVKRAPILVLDEPTSALDTETEEEIMSMLKELSASHTILFTTHKLGNTAFADCIVTLENGRTK